jgi:hypothetical protein
MIFQDNILAMDGNPIELRRGDSVTVRIGAGGTITEETIEAELSALVSSTQNKVFIEALPNQEIGVSKVVDDSYELLTQGTTNTEGNLTLSVPISPNELFYICSADVNSNFTSFELWPAYGMVTLSDDSLWGSGYISDATATVEVYNGDTKLAGTEVIALPDGSFLADDFSPEIDIVSGNTIKIIAKYETTEFVANLVADIDCVTDMVLGTTTPNSYVIARVAPAADPLSSSDETATASLDGDFMINAAMESGDSIWLASIHPDGNITQTHQEFGTNCYSHGNPVIFANKQNQNAGAVSIEELGPRSISSHPGANEISLNIQTAGVTFSDPPQATCDGVGLDDEAAALSPDGRTATWTVSECTTQTMGSIMIDDISYNAATSTPDGDVMLEVGGNSGVIAEMVSNAVVVTADTTPTTTISFEPLEPDGKNGWYVTETTITLSANETATIHYQWDGEATQTASSPVQFTAPEGEHTLTYFAVNEANSSETANALQIKVDMTAPTVPELYIIDTITASNVANVAVGGLAETDTVIFITASDGTNIIETTTTSGGTFNMSLDLSSLEDTNAVVFTAQAEDEAGNVSAVSFAKTALKDALAPITTITANPLLPDGKNGWYVTTPTIELSVDETANIFYQWEGDEVNTYTVPLVATEGERTLTAYAIDTGDDNDTGTPVSRLFKVDLTDPGQPALDPVATITASDVASVIVNGTTDTDTIVHILATDGFNEVTETATVTGSGFITAMDLTSLADTDTIIFTAYAEDEAGNVSDMGEPVEAFKDATRPMVIATSPSADETDVARDALIVITLSEPIEEGAEFGGISLETTSTTIPITTTVGTNTIEIDPISALSYGTVYTVTIPAAAVKDALGNNTASEHIFSFTTEKDIIPPTWSPTSTFTASEIGQTSVKLSWAGAFDNVGVTGYRIYSGVGSVHRATVAAVDSTTVTGLTPGTQYTFTIQARDAAGNWSGGPSCGPSVTVTTTSSSGGGGGGGGGGGTSDVAPTAPKSLKVISTQNMVRLGWTANTESDLAGYNVYRKVKDASGSSTKLNSTRITGVEYQDTTAQLGVVYVYYVTAVDNGNNESQKSNEVEAAVTIGPAGSIFFDVRPGDWFASFVSRLASLNIIGGYPDKSFRPHQNLTRAEFAKMLCLAMGWELQEPANPSFSDVPKGHWAYKYIETAKARGALGGYPDGSFRPSNSITRAEIAAAIARALNLSSGGSDLTDIALHWAKDQINACVQAGIISGYPGNVFRPNANATRAEASKMIAGVLDNK